MAPCLKFITQKLIQTPKNRFTSRFCQVVCFAFSSGNVHLNHVITITIIIYLKTDNNIINHVRRRNNNNNISTEGLKNKKK